MSNYEQEWDTVWNRKIQGLVGKGRKVYNGFFLRLLRPFLGKDKVFLEVGCGTASLLVVLAPLCKEALGLDISSAALEKAEKLAQSKKTTNARFIKGDCFAMPFEEGSIDVQWSQGLLEHFDAPEKIVAEQFRVCKKGGVVIASVPYAYSYHRIWWFLTRPRFLRSFWPWTDQRFFTKKQLLEVGKKVHANCRVYLLQPFFLGVVILEVKKD
ncbi:MAG: class I SAM-dependent methyltransferase [bacterium]